MPLAVTARLPRPDDSAEFERLAVDVLSRKFGLDLLEFGRPGQAQHGIDAFVRRDTGGLVVLQSKNSMDLSLSDVAKDVAKADAHQFPVALSEFLVATATSRDARLQELILAMSEERIGASRCPVRVFFWEDLSREIAGHPDLLEKYGYERSDGRSSRAPSGPRITCPRCHEDSKLGSRVCITCRAQIVYGATEKELVGGFVVGWLSMLVLAVYAVSYFGQLTFADIFARAVQYTDHKMLSGSLLGASTLGGCVGFGLFWRLQKKKIRFFWIEQKV